MKLKTGLFSSTIVERRDHLSCLFRIILSSFLLFQEFCVGFKNFVCGRKPVIQSMLFKCFTFFSFIEILFMFSGKSIFFTDSKTIILMYVFYSGENLNYYGNFISIIDHIRFLFISIDFQIRWSYFINYSCYYLFTECINI